MGRFAFILLILINNFSLVVLGQRVNTGSSVNSNNNQQRSPSSIGGTQHFMCQINGQSQPCDDRGNPINSLSGAIGGGKTKQQLISDCMNNDGAQSESCESYVTRELSPPNAVVIPTQQQGALGNVEKSYEEKLAEYNDNMKSCLNENRTVIDCENILEQDGRGIKLSDRCAMQGMVPGADNVACINQSTPSSASSDNTQPSEESKVAQDPKDLCDAAKTKTLSDCDTTTSNWMDQINKVAQRVGPAFSADQGACGTLAATNVGTTTSLAVFSSMCKSSYDECIEACSAKSLTTVIDATAQNSMKENLGLCRQKRAAATQAQERAGQATQQIQSAVVACRAQFGNSYDSLAAAANQNYQSKLAESGVLQSGNGNPGLNTAGVGSGAGGSTGTGSMPNISGLLDEGEKKMNAPGKNGPGEDVGGHKGGGRVAMNGGGSGNASSGGGGTGRGSGSGGLLSNILSGFFGGGGGSGLGSRGSGGSSSGWRSWFGGGGAEEQKVQAKTPDLRQFLPGGMMDPKRNRGIAGQWVGADGLSGPHANMWRLINNRYQYKKATLLP